MRHLYLHVPFCARRCVYCDFAIAVRRVIPADRYVGAVLGEHALRRRTGRWSDAPLQTLYLGGGTPSRLPPHQIARLVEHFPETEGADPTHPDFEVTLEANPDDVTPDAARLWVRAGVTRVSLGVQSFDPTVLAWMHRTHDAEAGRRAVEVLRDAGVGSVSLDLIFGRPRELRIADFRVMEGGGRRCKGVQGGARRWRERSGGRPERTLATAQAATAGPRIAQPCSLEMANPQSAIRNPQSFAFDLHQAIALAPDHLSVYGLTVEPGTALRRWVARGRVQVAGERRYAGEFLLAHRLLTGAGFEHYEVSNYARPGHRARHNSAYWRGDPYAGLGPSAHSYVDGERRWNIRDWEAYHRALAAGQDPTAGRECLTDTARRLERVYLGLRTVEGARLADFGSWPSPVALRARERGWLTWTDGRVRLTPEGWLRLDELVPALTTSAESG